MNKVRRIDRLVAMTQILTARPHHLFPLSYFNQLFDVAKSTLSEDLVTIRESLAQFGLGSLETLSGAAGGVRYLPYPADDKMAEELEDWARALSDGSRIIPGGFLYMSDLLFDAQKMMQVGHIFAKKFAPLLPEAVMTVETKGIPLAMMIAYSLNLPLVIVRRGSKVTEGPAVSLNYVSGSSRRIQTMSLPKRALKAGARVLVVDDFMKAGGTAKGMIDLAQEVGAEVVGTGVLMATAEPAEKLVHSYWPLLMLEEIDEHNKHVVIRPNL